MENKNTDKTNNLAKQVKRRRGNTKAHAVFTGAEGEITIDTDKNTIVIHDGKTKGGYPLPTANDLSEFSTFEDLREYLKKEDLFVEKKHLSQEILDLIEKASEGDFDDSELKASIKELEEIKLDKESAKISYRHKQDNIEYGDLSKDVRDKLDGMQSGEIPEVDLEPINNKLEDHDVRIGDLEDDKIDPVELNNKIKDINDKLNSKADNDSLELYAKLTELNDYLRKDDTISIDNIGEDVKEFIKNNAGEGEIAGEYDKQISEINEKLLNKIDKEELDKYASKESLNDYRSKDQKLRKEDISESLLKIILNENVICEGLPEDDVKELLEHYRRSDIKITKDDLDDSLENILDDIIDENTVIKLLEQYRKIDDKITEDDIEDALLESLKGIDTEELSTILEDYRKIDDKITKDDIAEELLNEILNEQIDLTDYFNKDENKITEDQLSEGLKNKIEDYPSDDALRKLKENQDKIEARAVYHEIRTDTYDRPIEWREEIVWRPSSTRVLNIYDFPNLKEKFEKGDISYETVYGEGVTIEDADSYAKSIPDPSIKIIFRGLESEPDNNRFNRLLPRGKAPCDENIPLYTGGLNNAGGVEFGTWDLRVIDFLDQAEIYFSHTLTSAKRIEIIKYADYN